MTIEFPWTGNVAQVVCTKGAPEPRKREAEEGREGKSEATTGPCWVSFLWSLAFLLTPVPISLQFPLTERVTPSSSFC